MLSGGQPQRRSYAAARLSRLPGCRAPLHGPVLGCPPALPPCAGKWDPYPIDMCFHPPCVTVSSIGLARPGVVLDVSSWGRGAVTPCPLLACSLQAGACQQQLTQQRPRPRRLQGDSADECKTHLHQMHVCLPARRGHTRLLYRM